jgi:hypothetical protein
VPASLIPGVSFQSRVDGVDQEVRTAVADRDGPLFLATSFSAPCAVRESFSPSDARGVGQEANCAVVPNFINPDSCPASFVLCFLANTVSIDSPVSVTDGVGQEARCA